MFTGIIETVGTVCSLSSGRLVLRVSEPREPWRIGESVAVNGCCLTVVSSQDVLAFDLSPETLARTSLGSLKLGGLVNIERAMRADGRFGGHVVQGHVDATGAVMAITPVENAVIYRFKAPTGFDRYLIDKGSVAVDGISLTVVKPKRGEFETWIIPHTLENTSLKSLKVGDPVNLEFDVIAKYVERLMKSST